MNLKLHAGHGAEGAGAPDGGRRESGVGRTVAAERAAWAVPPDTKSRHVLAWTRDPLSFHTSTLDRENHCGLSSFQEKDPEMCVGSPGAKLRFIEFAL